MVYAHRAVEETIVTLSTAWRVLLDADGKTLLGASLATVLTGGLALLASPYWSSVVGRTVHADIEQYPMSSPDEDARLYLLALRLCTGVAVAGVVALTAVELLPAITVSVAGAVLVSRALWAGTVVALLVTAPMYIATTPAATRDGLTARDAFERSFAIARHLPQSVVGYLLTRALALAVVLGVAELLLFFVGTPVLYGLVLFLGVPAFVLVAAVHEQYFYAHAATTLP
jgi:hypothetical protein